jgi:ATP-dependent protease ClpP protease subunit
MSSSDLRQQCAPDAPTSYGTPELLRAMTSGRSILISEHLTAALADRTAGRLFELSRSDPAPLAIILSTNTGDFEGTMLLLDHVRLCPVPVLGVAVTAIGALSAALLQACTWRYARRETFFELKMSGGWLDTTITLGAGITPAEASAAIQQAAAWRRRRLDALAEMLASRSTLPTPEWAERIRSALGLTLDEGLRLGLVDAIID